MPPSQERAGGPRCVGGVGKLQQGVHVCAPRGRARHHELIDDLLATEVQLVERPPHRRVEPEHGAEHFLDDDAGPVAPPHVQQLVAQHGASGVEAERLESRR